MAKEKTHKCQHCDAEFPIDKARCTKCRLWNIEPAFDPTDDGVISLADADDEAVALIPTGPWDPCFGRQIISNGNYKYGMPRSAVTLLGGKNGAGKSTLILQVCEQVCKDFATDNVLIVSVEEAAAQVKRLGKRLKLKNMSRIKMTKGERDLGPIFAHYKPQLIVVDSLPALCPDLGNAVEFAKRLKSHVEELGVPAILVNHINKEEEFAGLESLQHYVDATLIFTVDVDEIRELRSVKNRNAPSGVRVFFDMTDDGLKAVSEEELERRDDAEDEEN